MLRNNLFFLFSTSLVAIASTVLSIFNYNPYDSKNYQFVIMYISLFVSLTCILSVLIFYTKILINKKEVIYSFFWSSIRQSTIFSLGIISLLVLKGLKLLDIWIGAPIFIAILLLELFFQTKRKVVHE